MTELFAAFMLGLVSAGHCLGMCGGIVMATGIQARSPIYAVLYNLGRLGSYLSLAVLFGLFASFLPAQTVPVLKMVSAALLFLTALYLLGINHWINRIEAIGKPIWSLAQPAAKALVPVRHPGAALMIGYFWGFIPCGLVYTALTFSLAQTSLLMTVLSMLCFGLGTFPAMMSATLLASSLRRFLAQRWLKRTLAALMVIMAITILNSAFRH